MANLTGKLGCNYLREEGATEESAYGRV